jgi:hypothetical protein
VLGSIDMLQDRRLALAGFRELMRTMRVVARRLQRSVSMGRHVCHRDGRLRFAQAAT